METPPEKSRFYQEKSIRYVLLACCLAFAPLAWGELSGKDLTTIENESVFSGMGSKAELFLRSSPPIDPHYRFEPLSRLSLAMELDGSEKATLPRLSNLLILLALSFALYLLVRRLGLGVWAATWAILIFTIHPTHVEVVATLAGRSPLAGHLFALTAALLGMQSERSKARSALIFLLFLAAGLCARSALLWGLFPLAYAWAQPRKQGEKSLIRAPFIGAALIALASGWIAAGHLWPAPQGRYRMSESWLQSIGMNLSLWGSRYPALLLFPNSMTPDPAASSSGLLAWPTIILSTILLLGLVFLAKSQKGFNPPFAIGIIVFLIGVVPTLTIFDGDLPSQVSCFFATLSLPFVVGATLQYFEDDLRRRRYLVIVPLLLIALTHVRSYTWRSDDILMETLPGGDGPLAYLRAAGNALDSQEGELPKRLAAEKIIAAGIDSCGPDPRLLYFGAEFCLSPVIDSKMAESYLEKLTEEHSHFVGIHGLVGRFKTRIGRHNEAISAHQKGRKLDPFDINSRWFLGLRASQMGQPDQAEMLLREGLARCKKRHQQGMAVSFLTQLGHLMRAGDLSPELFRALCIRQQRYLLPDSIAAKRVAFFLADT